MKFRDSKRGITYDDIIKAKYAYCNKVFPRVKNCNLCELGSRNNFSGMICPDFCEQYPEDAAEIMGYRVIKERDKA